MKRVAYANTSLFFVAAAALCLLVADLSVKTKAPWNELWRVLQGILKPEAGAIEAWSIVWTVAFAVLGVGIGAGAGLALAPAYPSSPSIRTLATMLRSVHELFWALLLIQVFGLGATTGILAIAIPYTGYFAKVYSEMIEEADLQAVRVLPPGTTALSGFAYARMPDLARAFKTYTLYRLECGLRSTLVLGFIGLPTIGFHLESYFRQGHYGPAAALLGVFYVLIGTRRIWARPAMVPFLLAGSILVLPASIGGGSALLNLYRFLAVDIVPAPLRGHDLAAWETWRGLLSWLTGIVTAEGLPGIVLTLVLAQIALVAAGVIALAVFPMVSRRFAGRIGQPLGRVLLVVVRSTPEYMVSYVLLIALGPSMLPAIIALSVHNGCIIGYLMGRHADDLRQRLDAPRGLNLYAYDTVPRLYGQFLAYMLYRWEIIIRESAIFGILGIKTLGYYVDAAIQELKLDEAIVLILVTVLLSFAVDLTSRRLRAALRLGSMQIRTSAAG